MVSFPGNAAHLSKSVFNPAILGAPGHLTEALMRANRI